MKYKIFLVFSFAITGLLALVLGCSKGPASPGSGGTDTPTVPTSPTFTFTVTGTLPTATYTPSPTLTGTPTFTTTITGTPTNTATSNRYPTLNANPSDTFTPVPTSTQCVNSQGTPCTPDLTATPYPTTAWSSFVTLGQYGTEGVNGNFEFPMGVAAGVINGSTTVLAVSDEIYQNIQIFTYSSSGTTFAYSYSIQPHGGAPNLYGLAIDGYGELYSADYGSGEVDGYYLGTHGYTYDYTWTGQGNLSGPDGIKIDANGNLVVADFANQTIYNLQWTDDAVLNQTVGGTPFPPNDVALDSMGNLYVADSGGQVDEYSSTYVFTNSFNGSNWPAPLGGSPTGPSGIGVDSQGNLFISDTGNGRVVYADVLGDYLGEIDGFILPNYLALDSLDNLYIADGDGLANSQVYEYQKQ